MTSLMSSRVFSAPVFCKSARIRAITSLARVPASAMSANEAQQEDGVDQGRDPDPRVRALLRGAEELVGEETGKAALPAGNEEPYGVLKRGLLRAHAQRG